MKGRGRQPEQSRSAREAAYRILRRVEQEGAYASVLLEQQSGEWSHPREAALLHELVLGVLRRRSALDHALGKVASRPPEAMDSSVLRALRLGAYSLLYLDRIPDFASVDTTVELVKRTGNRSSVGFVNAVLRALVRRRSEALPPPAAAGDTAALALAHSHPGWWVRRRVERWGWEATVRLLEADNRPAATVLRPNLRRTTPRDLQLRLANEGVRTEPCRFVPEALRVRSGIAQATRTFRQGFAWIQDEASQLIPRLFGRVLRPRVADLCAAPGIKSLQLAEALPLGGTIVAVDRHPGRMGRLLKNMKRTGSEGILPLVAEVAPDSVPLRTRFDHLLVDAPCSGTGTLRRHPEIRWRLRPSDLEGLAATQGRILDAAASLLAPGGSLVYAVCSLEPEEGENVLAAFLARHPEFRIADPRAELGPQAGSLVGEDGALRTSPEAGETDGFFGARLVRG